MDDNGDVITCLNITFEINRHSASNLEGLFFNLENRWNGDYKACFRLNFTTGLTRTSVYDITTQTKNRPFYFDCFCDLKKSDGGPEYDYILKIRSLPFQTANCTLVDDQTITSKVTLPRCGDTVRTWTDKYCQAKKKETWNPFIAFYQAFPEYNTLRLTFEPAPLYYLITQYEIYIHTMEWKFFVDGQIIDVNDLIITPVEINGSSVNATSRDYAEVNAKPGDSITVTIIAKNDVDEVAHSIQGPVIIFQENPCDVNSCGPLGSCVPLGHDYYCQCQEGTVNLSNHTCIPTENPCDVKTCGPLGSCIPLGHDYYCQCQEGTVNLSNHTCIQSTDQARDSSWQVITGAAVVGALVVFILIAIGLYRKHHRRFLAPIEPPELVLAPIISDAQFSDDILFAYPEENSEFVKLVEKLAIYILRRGGIHPVLPSQHTLEMGKQGRELWLETASARAKKILWICSAEMTNSRSSNFEKLLTLTKDDREERRDKHVVCFFSAVSSRTDVPRRLGDFERFDLLKDLESMCFYLNDIEKHTLHYSESMPYFSGLEPSPERTALENALEEWAGNRLKESQPLIPDYEFKDSGFNEGVKFAEPFSMEDDDRKTMANAWRGLITLSLQDESDSDNIDSAYSDKLTGGSV